MPRGTAQKLISSDELFLVSPEKEYTVSIDAKNAEGLGNIHMFLLFKDIDGNDITPANHSYIPASTTTLANGLNPGDTVIHFTDLSGWSTSKADAEFCTIWNYANSYGYVYPPGVYSRNNIRLPHTSNSSLDANFVDFEANTITLSTPYTGSPIPAGTTVSQGCGGAAYKYLIKGQVLAPEWVTYKAKISGIDLSGGNVAAKFPPGTTFATVGFLWNYNKSNDQVWITNVSVRDTTEITSFEAGIESTSTLAADLDTRLFAAESIIHQLADSISMLVTNGDGTSLMTQTENGWTFSTADIQNNINSAAEALHNLSEEFGDAQTTINILKQGLDDLGVLSEYVKIESYEDEPCIELGEGDSNFKLRITNTRIMFMDGSDIPAYINNKSLYIKKAVIEEELHHGGFAWVKRANGHLSLVWKGADS